MPAHLNSTTWTPCTQYLCQLEHRSILHLGRPIITCVFKDGQFALYWVEDYKAKAGLAGLLLGEKLECVELADDQRNELDTRLLKLFDELDGLKRQRALRPGARC